MSVMHMIKQIFTCNEANTNIPNAVLGRIHLLIPSPQLVLQVYLLQLVCDKKFVAVTNKVGAEIMKHIDTR